MPYLEPILSQPMDKMEQLYVAVPVRYYLVQDWKKRSLMLA
jgi:hypothetical protein